MKKDDLRPVEVHSHNTLYRGWFHGWAGLSEYPKPIVEDGNGNVSILGPAYTIKFLDRKDEDETGTEDS